MASALCSIHFSDEMWRETRGGKRRLKSTAVPTIFGDRLIQTSVQEEDEPKNIPENEHENFNNTSQEAQERPINNGDVHNNSEEIQETEGSIEELKEKTPFEETLEQRFNRLQKLYDKSEKSRIALKKSLIAANKRNKKLQQEVRSNKLKESLSCILNEDQIKLLTREYKRMPRWCNETLINAYKLRFACGTAGYEEILRQKLPFPCIRVLTRKLENLKFFSGEVITEVFEFFKIKIACFEKDLYKDCIIVLDEMSITPGRFYDTSTNMYVGNVTLVGHDHTATATHALVVMLAGLGARWKQVVRYDLTGDSVKGANLKPVIDEIKMFYII